MLYRMLWNFPPVVKSRWPDDRRVKLRQEDLIAHGDCVSVSSGQVSGVEYRCRNHSYRQAIVGSGRSRGYWYLYSITDAASYRACQLTHLVLCDTGTTVPVSANTPAAGAPDFILKQEDAPSRVRY